MPYGRIQSRLSEGLIELDQRTVIAGRDPVTKSAAIEIDVDITVKERGIQRNGTENDGLTNSRVAADHHLPLLLEGGPLGVTIDLDKTITVNIRITQ